jgi:ADP-heptose:LPS heptosyltransferase
MLAPKNILMIKSHSMGVGDLLRSSAAWRALHNRFPGVRLHLLFLSKHAGYPTEALMRNHHLLASAHFVTIREGDPGQAKARRLPLGHITQEVERIAMDVDANLVIDFEANGTRSSWLARKAAWACKAQSVGIAQFPGRSLFYDLAAPSVQAYKKQHGLPDMMDYTERDFVVLAALGIERQGTPIELEITQAGRQYAQLLQQQIPVGLKVVGLNIGCGTADALPRRPPLEPLAQAVHSIGKSQPCMVLLSGAPFEKAVNDEFIILYRSRFGEALPMLNVAGEASLSALTGLISLCDVFISSDSGPYHMAVAMRRPTAVWFVREEPPAIHQVPWCRCMVNPDPEDFAIAVCQLEKSQER